MSKYLYLLDNPNDFFANKEIKLKETILYLLSITLVFTSLNELSIRLGFTKYIPIVGPLESILINWFSIVAGVVIVALFIMFFVKDFKKSLFVLVYSITPLLFLGWLPFAVIKTAVFLWSMFFFAIGLKIKTDMPYKKTVVVIAVSIAVMLALILLSQNEILAIIPLQRG